MVGLKICLGLVFLPAALVRGVFVWAALKDGQEDQALQTRLGPLACTGFDRVRSRQLRAATPRLEGRARGKHADLRLSTWKAVAGSQTGCPPEGPPNDFGISDERLIEIDRY